MQYSKLNYKGIANYGQIHVWSTTTNKQDDGEVYLQAHNKALFLLLSCELYKTQQLLLAYKYHSQPLEQLEYSKLQTVKQLLYSSLSLNIPSSSQHDWLYDYQKIRLFPGSETILPCSEALLSSSLSHSCTEDEVEYTISPKTKAKKRPGNEISLTVMSLHITHGI